MAKMTSTPARLLGIEKELGNLRRGSLADIAVFELKKGHFTFEDAMGKTVVGKELLEPAAVVKDGQPYCGRLRLTGRK